jgi:hypothetical protein
MPLRSARLTGDPILENCLNNTARIQAPDDNLSVKRVQQALIDLGRSVGPAGADGIFGQGTGAAVIRYKTDKQLFPNDPVVGPKTTQALDDDLFFDPPSFDPVFAEYSPFVVNHRVEQFVALELSALLNTPLDSFRHMLGNFAITNLSSGLLLGIVAQSRGTDLRDPFLRVADPLQRDQLTGAILPADQYFDDEISLGGAIGATITFFVGGVPRSFIVVHDIVILGRAFITQQSTGRSAKETTQSVVVHELTHARNLAGTIVLMSTADSDTNVYSDTVLAAARSAAGRPTADTLRSFVHEMTARHVSWVVRQELAGTPGNLAVRALSAGALAAAVRFYFVDTNMFSANGYVPGIRLQGDAMIFDQLAKWLNICATQSFSDIPDDDAQSRLVFQAAARFCADRVANPIPIPDAPDGLFPLPQDFV